MLNTMGVNCGSTRTSDGSCSHQPSITLPPSSTSVAPRNPLSEMRPPAAPIPVEPPLASRAFPAPAASVLSMNFRPTSTPAQSQQSKRISIP